MTQDKVAAMLLACVAVAMTGVARAESQGFITAAGRADIAFDARHDVLYISGGDSLRRYDIASGRFLSSIALGGATLGLDISPDGRTLAVANSTRSSPTPFVDLVNLDDFSSTRVNFNPAFGEGGTFDVAFDSQGKLLVTSNFLGSGFTPLRRYDPIAGTTTVLGSVTQSVMLAASGDRSVIGVVEPNISDGRWGYYRTGDASYASQHQYYDPVSGGTSTFNYEIAVSRDGSRFAIPTYRGTFIGDAVSVSPQIGLPGSKVPIGVAFSPVDDLLFAALGESTSLVEYNATTLAEVARFTAPGTFDAFSGFAFQEGRTKVASDGSYVFATLDNGVYFASLAPVPEPGPLALMLTGLPLMLALGRCRFGARNAAARTTVGGSRI